MIETLRMVMPWFGSAVFVLVVGIGIRLMIIGRLPVRRVQIGLVPSREFAPSQADLDSFHTRLAAATTNMAASRLFGARADGLLRLTYITDDRNQVVLVVDLPSHARSLLEGTTLPGVENWIIGDLLEAPGPPGPDVRGTWLHHNPLGETDRVRQVLDVSCDIEAGRLSVDFDDRSDPTTELEMEES